MLTLHNKTILLGSVIGLSLLMLSTMARADNGLTATGTQLPIGTSAGTVLTITGGGTSGDANFTGTLETGGNATFSGSGSFSGTLSATGNATFSSGLTASGVGNILGGLEIGTEGNGGFIAAGTSQLGPMLSLGGTTTNNTDPIYFQRYNENYDTTSLRLVIGDNSESPYVPGSDSAAGDAFIIGALNTANNDAWVPNFTFTSNGLLGIGTTTPEYPLDVTGIIRAGGHRVGQGSPNNIDASTNGYAFGTDGDTGLFSPIRTDGPTNHLYDNGELGLFVNGLEAVHVQYTGNVGIGTASPAGTLDVENGGGSAALCLNGVCKTRLPATYMVSLNTLVNYHSGCTGTAINPQGSFTAWCTSACNRYCSGGCGSITSINSCLVVQPGLGYTAGTIVEYDGITNMAACACF